MMFDKIMMYIIMSLLILNIAVTSISLFLSIKKQKNKE